eukprot:m.158368 g.158368  ORF g.158368 m.158368 type:complete len:473 (+) comp31088_c0_seq1:253-1671(+)
MAAVHSEPATPTIGTVAEIIDRSNKELTKAIAKMKILLTDSCTDRVKIKVARERVKQAKLKAEHEYLKGLMGEPSDKELYVDTVAARISALVDKSLNVDGDNDDDAAGKVSISPTPKTQTLARKTKIEPTPQEVFASNQKKSAEQIAQQAQLDKLQQIEDGLKKKVEAEALQKIEKERKLKEAKEAFEAKRTAAADEKKRQDILAENARKRQEELMLKQQAALEVEKQEKLIKDAGKDDDLSEWHGTNKGILSTAGSDAMIAIEEAERQAINEIELGSANSNDAAILRAMMKTNPNAYQEKITEKPSVASPQLAEDSKQFAEKQRIREQYGIPTAGTLLRKPKTKTARNALGDADYLLSMINAGIDEGTEETDSDGVRYHINDGEKVYRGSDIPDNMSRPESIADSDGGYMDTQGDSRPPSQQWSSTLERRKQNLSDVERRKEEAERRKKEAKLRSMERQKAFDNALSETGF